MFALLVLVLVLTGCASAQKIAHILASDVATGATSLCPAGRVWKAHTRREQSRTHEVLDCSESLRILDS